MGEDSVHLNPCTKLNKNDGDAPPRLYLMKTN